MLDFQQKRKFKKVLYSRITIFCLFIFVIFIAHSTYDIFIKEKSSMGDLSSVKKDYSDLDKRRSTLQTEISKLQTEEGIEADIRDKYSVAKPGETVISIVDNSASTTNNTQTEESFWQRVLNWFK